MGNVIIDRQTNRAVYSRSCIDYHPITNNIQLRYRDQSTSTKLPRGISTQCTRRQAFIAHTQRVQHILQRLVYRAKTQQQAILHPKEWLSARPENSSIRRALSRASITPINCLFRQSESNFKSSKHGRKGE